MPTHTTTFRATFLDTRGSIRSIPRWERQASRIIHEKALPSGEMNGCVQRNTRLCGPDRETPVSWALIAPRSELCLWRDFPPWKALQIGCTPRWTALGILATGTSSVEIGIMAKSGDTGISVLPTRMRRNLQGLEPLPRQVTPNTRASRA